MHTDFFWLSFAIPKVERKLAKVRGNFGAEGILVICKFEDNAVYGRLGEIDQDCDNGIGKINC